MSLIKELQQLIQTDREVAGRVILVSGTSMVIATASGQIEVPSDFNLQPGDLVTVENGRVAKKQRDNDAPVFFV
jgi:hypothetical protein